MALILADRVRETTTTAGTGTVTLDGAVTGYQSFSAIGNANTTFYCIAGQGTSEWEVGIGTYTSSGTTLSRDTVLSSSNGGAKVVFSAGTKDVFVTYPSGKSINQDASGNTYVPNLGASTASSGAFTTTSVSSTVSGSSSASLLSITPTWNTTGTPTALLMNVTDTASNAASKLLDLQVGGTSKLNVDKTGLVTVGYGYNVGGTGAGNPLLTSGTFYLGSGTIFSWGTAANRLVADLVLLKEATQTLAQRNGTNAQAYRLYNTYTDASNYERLAIQWSGNTINIGPEAAGTGIQRQLAHPLGTVLVDSPLSITQTWNGTTVATTGASGTGTTATITFAAQTVAYPVGSTIVVSGVTPTGYNGTYVVTASTTTSVSYASATTGAQTVAGTVQQQFTGIRSNITDTASTSGSLLMDLQVGGTSKFNITKGGAVVWPGATVWKIDGLASNDFLQFIYGTTPGFAVSKFGYIALPSTGYLGFSSSSAITLTPDTILARDAANTLAQRNGTNAQTYRLYNTYTDASNYERAAIKWSTNVFSIGPEAAGTGTLRQMQFPLGTATASTPLSITQTWNSAGTTFTGIQANMTDTASAAGSLLLDLQVGGASKFNVNKAGSVTPAANVVDAVGYVGMPQNSQSAAYTTVAADAGKTIVHPIADNNARTFTIDSNANVPFPVGTTITFINMINTVTIAITSDTLYLAGTGSTGSRTLAAYGIATAIKVGTTSWIISGNGLT